MAREAHALFQPTPHDPPFVVAVLLDKTQKRLKMMYHLSWLKSEQVNAEFFRRWMHHALTFPLKQRKKDGKKNGKKRPNTVKRKGLAVVQPTLFAELFQIRVSQVVAAKVEFYIHAELHLIEVNLELPFSQFPSSSVVEALLAHTAFSDDPHHVTVIPTLEFFDPTRHLFRPHADHPPEKAPLSRSTQLDPHPRLGGGDSAPISTVSPPTTSGPTTTTTGTPTQPTTTPNPAISST